MKALLLLVALLSSTLYADSIYLSLNSYHYNNTGLQSSHSIIGGEYKNIEAFSFVNSKGRDSWYVGYIDRKAYHLHDRLYMGYSAGIVHGYGDKEIPFIFPMLTYTYKRLGADLIMLADQGVALRLRVEF